MLPLFRPGRGPDAPAEVFAVEDTTAQLVWRRSRAGVVLVEEQGGRGRSWKAETAGGTGTLVLHDLEPATEHRLTLTRPGEAPLPLTAPTLAAPAGPERCRIATVSDLHIGVRAFGARETIVERPRRAVQPDERCARAAFAEAVEWGAELIVLKGDATNTGRRMQWKTLARLIHELPVPVVVLPGNHDHSHYRTIEPWQAGVEYGLDVVTGPQAIDLPGIRVVLAPTHVMGRSLGTVEPHRDAVVALAADAPAALVCLHHHLEHHPQRMAWPPGIPRAEADVFLHDLAVAQPAALVTSGHTHRHRRASFGPVAITLVGATKDYPGVWAGYAVHDHAIRQLVRRVAQPDCLEWTELTRRGAAGRWGHLSPGTLHDRCFVHAYAR